MRKNAVQFILGVGMALLGILLIAASARPAAAGARVKRGLARVEGGYLYYEAQGRGPAVVLIHGGQMDRRMWDAQFDILAEKHRVIRYDVRGYGRSEPASRPFSHTDDLLGLLKHLGVSRASLVGLSLGGMIAVDFALAHPDRVEALVLSGPGVTGFEESPEARQRFYAIIEAARDEGYEKATERWLADPYMKPAMENEAIRDRVRRLSSDNSRCWLQNWLLIRSLKPPAWGRLAEIKAPTLVLVGDRDVPEILTITAALEKNVPGARKSVIPGAGHILPMEKPGEFNEQMLSFLAGVGKE